MQLLLPLFAGLLACSCVRAQTNPLFPTGEPVPNRHHAGEVWLSSLAQPAEDFPYGMTVARFAPGARLNWHTHPAGQRLLITRGVGYYQERGKEQQILRQGEVVTCPPGVEHWHAAHPDTGVVYLALSGDAPTVWGDTLTDTQYHRLDNLGADAGAVETVKGLSKDKWQWMADKDVDRLRQLFHPAAQFVHMGGSWGTDRELAIIGSGGIWYKQADVHEVSVNLIDDTAVLLNRITLLAEVGGREVTNPFMVTEVYKELAGEWRLASLSFTRLRE